ncbi:COX5A-domain-containing protein [Mycena rebaudengoi]|nr:COX5A-domain-containing protein [Mycena rebaudengoi]
MMRSSHLASTLLRVSALTARPNPTCFIARPATRVYSDHPQESFESFTNRYIAFFRDAEDLFEVQRGLNNCFAHDLVPAPAVVEASVRAARRVHDFAAAVRVFEGVRVKVETKEQYNAYLKELKGLREELGITLEEELYPHWSR